MKEEITMEKRGIDQNDLEKVTGGYVVEDGKNYWIVRQNGSVISPAPDREKAMEFAKTFNTSPTVISVEEYKKIFGRDLVW